MLIVVNGIQIGKVCKLFPNTNKLTPENESKLSKIYCKENKDSIYDDNRLESCELIEAKMM